MSLSSNQIVRTVLGDLPASDLGHVQCHEHIFLKKGNSYLQNPALCMDDMSRSLRELCDYRAAGGAMIVDAQPVGCGRDGAALMELSAKSGVGIVAVTGFHKKCFFEDGTDYLSWPEEKLAQLYSSEVTEGLLAADNGRLSAKAGLIKMSCDPGCFTDATYGRLFTAAAAAAGETGAAVLVHTESGVDSLKLVDLLGGYGVAPQRIILCHLDRTWHDAEYHKEALSMGCFLCYDSVHRLKYVSDEAEIALLHSVKKTGGLKQILLSLDTTNQRLRAYHAKDMGLDYILTNFIPMLLKNDFSSDEIYDMCQCNPCRALGMARKENKG